MPEPCNYLLTDPKVFSETKIQVEQMLTGIKSAFRSMVESVDWLDNEAKQATLQKVDNIQEIIGVPEWMLNREELDRRSSKVYNSGGNFLLTLVNLTAQEVDHSLEFLGRNDSMRKDG
ncbi:hypothetical protein C0J52_24914 [Blattella germanica]|nr:hypothetical protein C0J52_24914 [Blattella germanica]